MVGGGSGRFYRITCMIRLLIHMTLKIETYATSKKYAPCSDLVDAFRLACKFFQLKR
jgi:hypothetical protein